MAVGEGFEPSTRAINPSASLAGKCIQPDSATQPWRTGWDSNPRAALATQKISSLRRYDHFGTCPYNS